MKRRREEGFGLPASFSQATSALAAQATRSYYPRKFSARLINLKLRHKKEDIGNSIMKLAHDVYIHKNMSRILQSLSSCLNSIDPNIDPVAFKHSYLFNPPPKKTAGPCFTTKFFFSQIHYPRKLTAGTPPNWWLGLMFSPFPRDC